MKKCIFLFMCVSYFSHAMEEGVELKEMRKEDPTAEKTQAKSYLFSRKMYLDKSIFQHANKEEILSIEKQLFLTLIDDAKEKASKCTECRSKFIPCVAHKGFSPKQLDQFRKKVDGKSVDEIKVSPCSIAKIMNYLSCCIEYTDWYQCHNGTLVNTDWVKLVEKTVKKPITIKTNSKNFVTIENEVAWCINGFRVIQYFFAMDQLTDFEHKRLSFSCTRSEHKLFRDALEVTKDPNAIKCMGLFEAACKRNEEKKKS